MERVNNRYLRGRIDKTNDSRNNSITHHVLEAVTNVGDPFKDHLLSLHHVVHRARHHHAASVPPKGRRPGVLLNLNLQENNHAGKSSQQTQKRQSAPVAAAAGVVARQTASSHQQNVRHFKTNALKPQERKYIHSTTTNVFVIFVADK